MDDMIIKPVNFVRIWTGDVIDMNNIFSISEPKIYSEGLCGNQFSSDITKKLKFEIRSVLGKDIIIHTDIKKEYKFRLSHIYDDGNYMCWWRNTDGVFLPECDIKNDDIRCYHNLKIRVNKLIEIWTKNQEIKRMK